MKKLWVTVTGGLLILSGLLLLITPFPGILLIALGLAVLSMEYHWSRRWLRLAQRRMRASATWLDRRLSYRRSGR